MQKCFLILYCFIFFSCDANYEEPVYRNNPILDSSVNVTFLPTVLVDTMYKDFSGKDFYNDSVFFGMSLKEWNKFVALSTTKGDFDKVETSNGIYNGFALVEKGVNLHMSAKFINAEKETDGKLEIIRIDEKNQNDRILSEVNLDFVISSLSYVNSITKNFINFHKLKFVAGSEALNLDENLPTLENINDWFYLERQIEKDFKKHSIKSQRENSEAEIESKVSKELKDHTQTLFENKGFYGIIRVEKISRCLLEKDSEGKYISLVSGYNNYGINIRACSKKFSEIKVEEFMTYQQKKDSDAKNTSKELIEKALE